MERLIKLIAVAALTAAILVFVDFLVDEYLVTPYAQTHDDIVWE